MLKKILGFCFVVFVMNSAANAQSKNRIFKKEDQKNIGVDYVSFDTSTKTNYYVASFKDYTKMEEDANSDKKKDRWKKTVYYSMFYEKKPSAFFLDNILTDVLKKSGFIDTVNQIFKNEGNMVYLQPEIGEENYYWIYEAPYEDKKKGNIFKCKVDIKWRITNIYSEVLDSINITTESNEFDSTNCLGKSSMTKFFTQAVSELLANKKLENYFKLSKTVAKPVLSSVTKPTAKIVAATEAQMATVIVKTEKGHGSGFAISNDGYIVTNYHVIASKNPNKPQDATIILDDGTKAKAIFIKANKDRDIALLKIDSKFEKCFEIPTQKNFKVFEEIYAMGAPKSIELGQSASKGILSSERNINNVNLLQVSMNINSGNSGGPMFSTAGNLVGVVSAKLFGFGVEGVAFGLPAYKIAEYLNIEFK